MVLIARIYTLKEIKKMIDDADICIFYYKKCTKVKNTKGEITNSGTKIALEYAKSKIRKLLY